MIATLLHCCIAALESVGRDMTETQLKDWTQNLLVRVVKLTETFPNSRQAGVFVTQLVRCAGSVGANYRSACRGRSDADMLSKLGIVEEEADECKFWLEAASKCGFAEEESIKAIHGEYDQIVAIVVASRRTLRSRLRGAGNTIRETRSPYAFRLPDVDEVDPQ